MYREQQARPDQTRSGHSLVTLANHCLNLAFVGWVDVVSVLRPHQHGSVLKGSALHVCPLALYDCGGQNGDHVPGEPCDVACHPHKHPCCTLQNNTDRPLLKQQHIGEKVNYKIMVIVRSEDDEQLQAEPAC